ncbi:C2 calcium-dependent membrane-targeting protein, partial [Tanacetum coccineum]
MKGGEQYVHGMSDDFKNHIRDINAFIGESDAQMLITKMENRKKFVPNFMFQYKVENCELVTMFWADEVDKCNYKELGDIISFDATFRTNKYDMVFVPFTGIDNHRKCVTIGSRLLLREDTKAYTWLLMSFMTAHEKQPTMIVTDQDGAMKLAIEEVLTESKQTLSMERQRYRQEVLEFRTFDSALKLHTKLKIEIHASKVYTRKIFLLVQKEIIEACWACHIQEFKMEEGCEMVKVRDKRATTYRTLNKEKGKEVLRSLEDGSVQCTCRHFLRYRFLCRHVFCVLKNRDIEVIPKKYILRRWRRDIILPALRRNLNRYGEKNETIEKLTNEANFVVDE